MTERIKHILRGMTSVVSLTPVESPSERLSRVAPHRTDADAMRADWHQVGQDIWRAVEVVARGQEEPKE